MAMKRIHRGSTFFPGNKHSLSKNFVKKGDYLFPRGSTDFLENKYWGIVISWEVCTPGVLISGEYQLTVAPDCYCSNLFKIFLKTTIFLLQMTQLI